MIKNTHLKSEDDLSEISFNPIQPDIKSRFSSSLEEMIFRINSPTEDRSLSTQSFVQKNITPGFVSPSKEECLTALGRTSTESLPSEKMEEIVAKWDKQKVREEKIETIAQRVHSSSPFPIEEAKSLVRRAFSFEKGTISRQDSSLIVGRLNSGEVIIGEKAPSALADGANVNVYEVTDFAATAEKVNHFVLKIQKYRSESGLSQEDELLNIAHEGACSPHIISPLEGRVIDRLSLNISEALQKKEGRDMIDLFNARDLYPMPPVEIIWQGVREARFRLREKGIIHLDNKLENLVVSLDGQTVKMIDLDKAFLKTTIPQNIETTREITPMEGMFWIKTLLHARVLLKLAQDNPTRVTTEAKTWLKNIKTILAEGSDLKLQPLLEKEFYDTAEKIENFHDGLLVWRYVNVMNGGVAEVPFGKHFTTQETWFQKAVSSTGRVFPFLEPKNFESQAPEIKEAITTLLDPSPFLRIFNKAKLLDENFDLRFKG